MEITAYRTTMPFLDNRLSPPTNKGTQLTIDRDLNRRKDLDIGRDHRMIQNPDTIAPSVLITPFYDGELNWNRTGLLGDNEKTIVAYIYGGPPIVYKNKSLDFVVKDLANKKIRWRIISPVVAKSSNGGIRKTAESPKLFVPLVADILASCFKVESESFRHNVKEIGSGFYLKGDLLITCAHVISKNKEKDLSQTAIFVIDGENRYSARAVDIDYDLDIALLYCDAPEHSTLETKTIAKISVGQEIICVGSPYGYDNNVTKGIISSKDRDLKISETPYFFMDLSVYPGSSGGPVVDANDGTVFGITAVIVESVGNYGLNAGIPIDICMERFSKSLSEWR